MLETPIFSNIMHLVEMYPWNNMLQIKVMQLTYQLIYDNTHLAQFLVSSGIAKSLTEMAKQSEFKLESQRSVRNGYMGLVVQISNKLVEKGQQQEEIGENLGNLQEWTHFVEGVLKSSNVKNNKTLGGK